MNRLLPFIRKEFYHIFRDTKILLILFMMPVVLVILFGFAIRTEVKDAHIAILDNSKDELSIGLTNKLLSTDYFICSDNLSSSKEIDEVFKQGQVRLVLVIPENFSEDFYKNGSAPLQMVLDATNINTSTVLKSYVMSIVEDYRREKLRIPDQAMLFDTTIRMVYNSEMKDIYVFVPGVLAMILMLVSAIMTAVSLAKEKESGTLKILIVSPLRISHIIVGKVLPYLSIAITNIVIILALSVWIFEMPILGSLLDLSLVCVLFLLTALSLGVFISSLAPTQLVAIFISITALFLPTMMLSGFIYPIENMPLPLQVISNLFPAKWFIISIKAIMIKGSPLSTVWFEMMIMVIMVFVFIGGSIIRYRKV